MRRLHQLIENNPPESLAVIDDAGKSYTYGDLERFSDKMAHMLSIHGVRGGDRVILLAENGITFALAVLALSKLDAWVVPLNARVTIRDIDVAMKHSGACCILYTVDDSSSAEAHAMHFGSVDLGAPGRCKLCVSPMRDVKVEQVAEGSEQVAALFYTSGTTGQPKGVMLTHANLIYAGTTTSNVRGMTSADRLLGVLPGTHVYGFGGVLLPLWHAGAAIHFMPRFDPSRVLEVLQTGITLLPGVPQMYAAILKLLRDRGIDKVETSLRFISAGGSPLDPDWKATIERVFGVHLHNGYGMTEASPSIAVTRLDDPRSDTSVGRALPGQELKLRDVADDGAGEICLRGPNVMKGYYKDAIATAEAISPDGFLRTGDIGRIDEHGNIHIVGRCKELIVHSGFNVYPVEIEAALNAHTAVAQAAVVGRKRGGNEDVLAFVTISTPVTEAELKTWMRDRVVAYKVPLHIVIVDHLPQAATGKILKATLINAFDDTLKQLDRPAHA